MEFLDGVYLALGGLQLFAIGLIGEYIGKMYLETKGRPRFAIQEVLDKVENEKGTAL